MFLVLSAYSPAQVNTAEWREAKEIQLCAESTMTEKPRANEDQTAAITKTK